MAAAGRGMDAYRRIAPRDATYRQLALLFSIGGQADDLAALVEAHRQIAPDEKTLFLWEGRVRFMREEYADAVRLLRQYQESIGNRPVSQPSAANDPLIRSLLRSGDTAGAMEEARAVHERLREPRYLAMVHAVAGRVVDAVSLLDECLREGYTAKDLLQDPDLGPALKSDAFAAWRAKVTPTTTTSPTAVTAPPAIPRAR
jgi:hypothetical protein